MAPGLDFPRFDYRESANRGAVQNAAAEPPVASVAGGAFEDPPASVPPVRPSPPVPVEPPVLEPPVLEAPPVEAPASDGGVDPKNEQSGIVSGA